MHCIVRHRLIAHEITREFVVPPHMVTNIMAVLSQRIDEWKGVCLHRIRTQPTKFREYFVTGKNWWDSAKRKYIGSTLWIRIFEYIERVKSNHPLSLSLYIESQ